MRALGLGCTAFLLALACGPHKPPDTPPVEQGSSAPEPQSAEWLYATEGVSGGRKAECTKVVSRLDEEGVCKGQACTHAAALAKDWLVVCKSLTPEHVSGVERRASELGAKASEKPVPCDEEVKRLLDNGCGAGGACGEAAQSWATRCSESSTPLVLRMLEVHVERSAGERTKLDGRGCPELLSEVAKAGACVQRFACEDGLGAVDAYKQRCVSQSQPLTATAAVVELALRAGIGPAAEPVAAATGKLEPLLVPLAFEDGSGAVLMTCGKRAKDVAGYLSLRKGCADEEVLLAKRFDGPNGAVFRLGRLPHPSDAAFLARYPSLRVEGEPKARYQAALPAFVAALDAAAKLGSEPRRSAEALRAFVQAIEQNLDAVRNSSDFEAALKDKDAALVPLFSQLGEAKKKALHADLPSAKLAPAALRQKKLALADVDAEGRVRLGAVTPAASIELGDLLPKASAAHDERLTSRLKLAEKRKLDAASADRLGAGADGEASRCGQAMKAFEAAEKQLLACAFGLETCDEQKLAVTGKKLDEARVSGEAAWPKAVVALASLPRAQRTGAEKAAELAGCREPWW